MGTRGSRAHRERGRNDGLQRDLHASRAPVRQLRHIDQLRMDRPMDGCALERNGDHLSCVRRCNQPDGDVDHHRAGGRQRQQVGDVTRNMWRPHRQRSASLPRGQRVRRDRDYALSGGKRPVYGQSNLGRRQDRNRDRRCGHQLGGPHFASAGYLHGDHHRIGFPAWTAAT